MYLYNYNTIYLYNIMILSDFIKGKRIDKIPIWIMRQAGRYLPEYHSIFTKDKKFFDICFDPELASCITLQPIERFDLDAAIIFSDILVIPIALGVNLDIKRELGPVVNTIKSSSELYFDECKLDDLYKAVKLTRSKLNKNKSLIGFSASPWTLSVYIIGGTSKNALLKTKIYAYQNPSEFNKIFDILKNSIIYHLKKQFINGCDVIQIFDTLSHDLNEYEFDKYIISPTKEIVSSIGCPVIGFPKGCGSKIIEYSIKTGVDVVSCDYSYSPFWLKKNLQDFIIVQGNLDPFILCYGNYNLIYRETTNIIKTLIRNRSNFIFNLGHGIIKDTPIDNVYSLLEIVRSFY